MTVKQRRGYISAWYQFLKYGCPYVIGRYRSDRVSRYSSQEFLQMMESYAMICSMGKKGDCWDNAVTQSFFHSRKAE